MTDDDKTGETLKSLLSQTIETMTDGEALQHVGGIVDLGADLSVGRCETTFEYVLRVYKYRVEYLAQAESASLSAAQASTAWHLYADRSSNTTNLSPVVDVGPFTARYLRITVLSANIPTAAAEIKTIIQTDYADRVSIVEFKAFAAKSVQ